MDPKDEPSTSTSSAPSDSSRGAIVKDEHEVDAPDHKVEKMPSREEIAVIESLIEANVQRSLDSLDAWKLAGPFRGDQPGRPIDPARCTREKHSCDLDAGDNNSLCVGCTLYRRIVRERSVFPVGGRSDVCDYMATGIAETLIYAFIKDGAWLAPASKITGRWFVKHPITFTNRQQSSMTPSTQMGVRRNRIRIYQADELLDKLGLTAAKESILQKMHDYWHTEAGGMFYSLDELLDFLGPVTTIAMNMHRIGIDLDSIPDITKLVCGVQKIVINSAN